MKNTAFCPLNDYFIEYRNYTAPHNMAVQHYHDSYEVYFLISGMRNHFIGEEYFYIMPGDVMLVKPFELHYSTSPEKFQYKRYVLNIKKHVLTHTFSQQEIEELFKIFDYRILHLNEKEQSELLNLLKKVDQVYHSNQFLSDKLYKYTTAEIFLFLKNVSDKRKITAPYQTDNEIIKAVRYINERYTENITLDDITEFLHMSKYHFCRVFKQFTGATFLEYLNNLRLTEAHQLLIHTKKSINEIALTTGFNSTAHFTRVFKQVYSQSPREFRKA